jgi:hypothetical protein
MDCRTARDGMATAVAEDLDTAETLHTHLSQCSSCQVEFEELRRTWVLLAAWADAEPPARLDRAILAEVRSATETTRSWLGWLASGRVWATGGAAAVLTIVASLVVPYQDSLRLCNKLLSGAGLALPALPLSFLVGFPYAFLPLLGAALPWIYLKGNGQKMHGLTVGQAFSTIMVPYILFACADLEASVIVGILLGTVTGGLLAGAVTLWVTGQQLAGVPA